ncbi:MAG: hypothetical protein GY861_21730 [bacterium]|nr:hypothetical protein [bacterium]
MKCRLFNVANSSSSSFVVFVKKGILGKGPNLMTDEVLEYLISNGFRYVTTSYPSAIENFGIENFLDVDNEYKFLACSILCNQDDVIEVLVRRRIPFIGTVHYGHYSVFYDGSDQVLFVANYGYESLMYSGSKFIPGCSGLYDRLLSGFSDIYHFVPVSSFAD